jgi:hypothetical protein
MPGHFYCLVKRDVANESCLPYPSLRCIYPVDSDVNYGSARLDPIAAHHPRAPDCCNDNVSVSHCSRQIASSAVRQCDCAVLPKEQLGNWLAHEIGSADHDRVASGDRFSDGLTQKDHATGWRAWDQSTGDIAGN